MAVKFTKPEINVREKLAELDKPSGIAGEAMLRAETPQEQFNLINAGRRNLLINGDMRINQRNITKTINTGAGGYSLDRFTGYGQSSDGVYTIVQSSTAPNGFNNSLKIAVTTADTSLSSANLYGIRTFVEGYDARGIAGGTSDAKPLTLSFWVRSNVTGTFGGGCFDASQTVCYIYSYEINTANTWEHKVVHIPAPTIGTWNTTTGRGFEVQWNIGTGSSYLTTPNTSWSSTINYAPTNQTNLLASTSNELYITGVQLELGKVATPFEHRSYGEELALCQRYYQKLFDTNAGTYRHRWQGRIGSVYSTTRVFVTVDLPVQMRNTPTILFETEGSGFRWNIYSANADIGPSTGIANTYPSRDSVGFDVTPVANLGSGYVGNACHMDVRDGWCHATAEL